MEDSAFEHIKARSVANEGIISGTLSKTDDFLVSTIVDTGAAMWNSVIDIPSFFLPESLEPDVSGARISTYDTLKRINDDYAAFFDEHRDTVQTASFIGGVLLPGGAAIKGMRYLRSGKFGFAPEAVTTGRATTDLARLQKLVQDGKQASRDFRDLRRGMYVRMAAGEAVDAVGMEIAVVGAMSTHPLMEDYMKDPWSNFVLWAGIGGAIGAGAGAIIKNNEVRRKLNTVWADAQKIVTDPDILKRVDIPSLPAADLAQRGLYNADIMKGIVENQENNQLTRDLAARMALRYEADASKALLEAIEPVIREGRNTPQQQELITKIQDILKLDGARGVDSVGFMELRSVSTKLEDFLPTADESKELLLAEKYGHMARYTGNSTELSKWLPDYKQLLDDLGKKKSTFVGYSPAFKAFVPKELAWSLQRAADLGKRRGDTINIFTPWNEADSLFVRFGKTTNPAVAHARYIDALHTVSKTNLATIPARVLINIDDLPVMSAWITKAEELVTGGKDVTFRIVTGGRKTVQDLSIAELPQFLAKRKEETVSALARTGAGVHEIATRTDMPVDVVEAFLFDRVPVLSFDSWRQTAAPDRIKEYLAPTTRMLKMTVDPRKKDILPAKITSEMAATLDSKTLDAYNRQFMTEAVINNKSSSMRSIHDILARHDTFYDILRQRIGEISSESVGTFFATSVDQALRRLDDVGTIIAQTSKDIYGVNNRIFQQLGETLSNLTRQIHENIIYKREFAEVVNTIAGVRGYVFMDDAGKFFTREETKDATGAIIKGQVEDVPILTAAGDQLQATHNTVRLWMKEMQNIGVEYRRAANTLRSIQGTNPLSDRGLWIPSYNPVNKFMAYVIDPHQATGSQVRVLVGKDDNHLATLVNEWKTTEGKNNPHMKVITKDEQVDYNRLQNRLDPIEMDFADIAMRHSGASRQAITPDADELLSTIMQNLHERSLRNTRKMVSFYLSDIMHNLDMMSLLPQQFRANQPLRGFTKAITERSSPAEQIKHVLLGESTLSKYGTWEIWNGAVKTLMEKAIDTTSRLFEKHVDFDNLGAMRKKDFIKLEQDMKQAGMETPFGGYNDYMAERALANPKAKEYDSLYAQHLRAKKEGKRSNADSIIAATNAITAALALRVGELAHPIVNAISIPILGNSTLMSRMPQSFLGYKLAGESTGGMTYATRALYDGVRGRFSPHMRHVMKRFEEEGFIAPIVSEASDVLRLVHSGEATAVTKVNKILDSGLVKKLSVPADAVETESRAIALSTGYQVAKRSYPGITDEGAMLFAKQFMDRAIGNYHSFQRPVMFQGTFGVAIGLFQTYMLSMAQATYRHIEAKEFKALTGVMLTQAGMFGMSSLPFYDLLSKTIGENFSDKHYDLTTGTYRALADPVAEFILYGLPSNIGSIIGSATGIQSLAEGKGLSLYTRGDLQPRLPFVTSNPIEQLTAANAMMQMYGAATHTIDKIKSADGGKQVGQALLEGLSMQNLSRPVGRGAEMIAGYSVSRHGNTIAGPEDVWSVTGIASRVLSSRTTEEQIKRHADHLNTYYGAIDYKNRRQAMEAIKTAIRANNLTDETLSRIAYEYMRTGTPAGWKAAMNEAIVGTNGGIDYKLGRNLKPDSPLNQMINDL